MADVAPLMTCDAGPKYISCVEKDTAAIKRELTGKFMNVEIGTFVDGMDSFYGDYKNRKIRYVPAMVYVATSMTGKSAEEMQKHVEMLRAATN